MLMQKIRDNAAWVVGIAVLCFGALIFVDWGTGRSGRSRGLAGLAARIGNVSISESQFMKEMRSTEQRYRQMYGDQFEGVRDKIDLASITIQNIVDRYLLLAEARKLGVEVTDKELLDKIMTYPAFKRTDGSFVGDDLYARILRANQTSPEEFEDSLRQDLAMQKLQQALAAGIMIPESDVESEYRRRNEAASFDVLYVPVDRALAGVTATEAV